MPSAEWMAKVFAVGVVVLGVGVMVATASFSVGVASGRLEERARICNEAAERGLGRWVTNTEFEWKEPD